MAVAQNQLVARAIRGERQALSSLLERHGPAVWQRVVGEIPRRWQSVLTREDVIQQTCVDAILDIHQLLASTDAAFFAWLCTLARRNLVDAIRMLEAEKRGGGRRRVEPGGNSDSTATLEAMLGGTSSTASRTAARQEASAALLQAMDRLPEDYRKIVRMYDIEGLGAREIAERVGRSPGSVFMLRARAHRRLRALMGRAGSFFSDSA